MKREDRKVAWCSDPMHGNIITTQNGYKARPIQNILSEIKSFNEIHHSEGIYAGGVHFELTGKDVIECIGGGQAITQEHLAEGPYETLFDPRLNATQALELAFQLSDSSKDTSVSESKIAKSVIILSIIPRN